MKKSFSVLIVFVMFLLTACAVQSDNSSLEPTGQANISQQPEPTAIITPTVTVIPTPTIALTDNPNPDIVIEDSVMTKYTGSATTVEVPYGVTAVGDYCFKENQALVTVILPDTVSNIGTGAFSQCHSLENVTWGGSLTRIGERAFWTCENLRKISSMKNIEHVGSMAFWECKALEEISSLDSIVSVGFAAFSGMPWWKEQCAKTDLFIANGLLLNASCEGNVTLSDSLIALGDGAFAGNKNLLTVTLPDSVTSIGEACFTGCAELREINMGNSVEHIGTLAFEDCPKLEQITFSPTLKSLAEDTFVDNRALASLTLPTGVESVARSNFWNCDELTSITISPDIDIKAASDLAYAVHWSSGKRISLYTITSDMPSDTRKAIFAEGLSLQDVKLSETQLELNIGESIDLHMNSYAICEWNSLQPTVAEVDDSGRVVAMSSGTAVITATLYGKEYQCEVIVK